MNHLKLTLSCIGLTILSASQYCNAVQAVLSAERDSSIFEDNNDNSSSIGDFIFAGTSGNRNGAGPSFRRGLIQFDISGSLPAGAVIESAFLTLTIGRVPDEKFVGTTQTLHRVTTAWGATDTALTDPDNRQGNGVPAQNGEATWDQAIRGTSNWTTPGGDFVATASASNSAAPVINEAVVWSSLGILNDIQLWLTSPNTNLGWLIMGNESFTKNARGYYSMDNSDVSAIGRAPQLTIQYSIVPEMSQTVVLFGGMAAMAVSMRRSRRR